jgi:DNA-binding transcriptional LysR family regulator
MAFNLPPLNTLRLFEAAARLESFKLAADEVHITPSAVSHAMQTLEDWLGAELFSRGPRGLSLTDAGRSYAPEVRRALSILAEATLRLPGRRATGTLSVSVAPAFANRWLIPRLSRFAERHPDIRVTIDTARRQVDFLTDRVDLAIRMSTAPRSGESWTELIPEAFVPVCSPQLRDKIASQDVMEVLRRAPLIHLTAASEDWDAWFRANGLDAIESERAICVDTIQLAVEAAVQGLGVAIGRKPLVDHYIESGQLVEIAGPAVPVATRYWLVGTHLSFERPDVKLFRSWILEELGSARSSCPSPRTAVAATMGDGGRQTSVAA